MRTKLGRSSLRIDQLGYVILTTYSLTSAQLIKTISRSTKALSLAMYVSQIESNVGQKSCFTKLNLVKLFPRSIKSHMGHWFSLPKFDLDKCTLTRSIELGSHSIILVQKTLIFVSFFVLLRPIAIGPFHTYPNMDFGVYFVCFSLPEGLWTRA